MAIISFSHEASKAEMAREIDRRGASIEKLEAERDTLAAEKAELVAALEKAIRACDEGRMVSLGVSGMTIEAQIKNSVYNRVPSWPIEEARDLLARLSAPKPTGEG